MTAFLYARLGGEGLDHHLRSRGTAQDGRAAAMVDEVLTALADGRPLERWIVDVLLETYRDHPDFEPRWLERDGARSG